jgi:hypothetical protein
MALHLKLQDAGSNDVLDGGELFEERKLYYREMIARFGHHLGIIWDLGEEITDVDEIKKRSAFIRETDPYKSPIVVHTIEDTQEEVYSALLGVDTLEGISVHSSDYENIASTTASWIEKSASAGRPWVVSNDEQGGFGSGVTSDAYGLKALWGNLMGGGSGAQYYFGTELDLTLEDFRSWGSLFELSRSAVDFFYENGVPFWDMASTDQLVAQNGISVFADSSGSVVVVYMEAGAGPEVLLDLPGSELRRYSISWYEPESGEISSGSVSSVNAGDNKSIGVAPGSDPLLDRVALIQCVENCVTQT